MSAVISKSASTSGIETNSGLSAGHTFQVSLLEQILRPMQAGQRLRVLDLGEPHGATVDFFSGHPVRLAIASALPDLVRLDKELDDADLEQCLETLLPASLAEGSQVVLAWDAFNYLTTPVLTALMSRLATLLPRGALMHALLAYGVRDVPERPGALVIDSWQTLRTLPTGNMATRQSPGYATGQLQRMMPDFRVIRSTLLQGGVQEFLIRR
ncbi:hypothetical protein [Thioalkalivibrio sulfidiphilus]|uniref:hypothetical protein n=1 Tax=Thioalkalivibrio sulfidiphilus TaxID=1033854 RepID=UPI00036411BB|nr:hypothetical protein [Thioalkalivibrio sulfidiphilus]